MKNLLSNPSVRQFISYFCVGGVSSVVEWVLFAVFANVFDIQYIVATVCAVIFSTAVNWYLGRMFVFKENQRFKEKAGQEATIIFVVAGVGLLFNLFLMWLFVDVFCMNTEVLRVVAKMMATAIVFAYNFLIRKLVIYR